MEQMTASGCGLGSDRSGGKLREGNDGYLLQPQNIEAAAGDVHEIGYLCIWIRRQADLACKRPTLVSENKMNLSLGDGQWMI